LRSADRKVRRGPHDDRRLGFVLTTYPSPGVWEAGLDQRVHVRITDSQGFVVRISGCAEHEADANVPEGDASGRTYLARDRGARRRDVRGRCEFRERLFQPTRRGGSAGEQERMPASKPIG
jgi:hypothetical protein